MLLVVIAAAPVAVPLSAQKAGAKVEIANAQGQPVGVVTLSPAPKGGVAVALDLKDLPPGRHAIHFHATARCEGPAFASAGGHYNPADRKHGLNNPAGPHDGDMNNFTVAKDGTARSTIVAPNMKLGVSGALVIHAGVDDLMTDPSGNSGDRIACGVISQ